MSTDNTTNDEGIIYLENPHQLPPRAYAFADEAEFRKWLAQACERKEFSYATHDRQSWLANAAETGEEEGGDWWNRWVKPGLDLFDAGAQEIVEVWGRGNLVTLADKRTAPSEIDAMLQALDDWHQFRVLRKAATLRELETDGAGLSHHQSWKCLARIEECANELGWIESTQSEEEETNDEE